MTKMHRACSVPHGPPDAAATPWPCAILSRTAVPPFPVRELVLSSGLISAAPSASSLPLLRNALISFRGHFAICIWFPYFKFNWGGEAVVTSTQVSKVKVRAGSPGKFSFPACCFLSISSAGLLVQRGSNKNLGVTLAHPHPFSLRRWLILLTSLRPKHAHLRTPAILALSACLPQSLGQNFSVTEEAGGHRSRVGLSCICV